MWLEPLRGATWQVWSCVLKLTYKEGAQPWRPRSKVPEPDPWVGSAIQGPEKGSGASVGAEPLSEESD